MVNSFAKNLRAQADVIEKIEKAIEGVDTRIAFEALYQLGNNLQNDYYDGLNKASAKGTSDAAFGMDGNAGIPVQ